MSASTTSSQRTAQPAERQQWSGQLGFILSAIGSAVGLGNIWRFPGVAYENGGGAFMIPYLIALLTAGIPILFLDYAIGHRFRGSAPLAFRRLKKWLESLGWFQVMICFFIAIYYAAILAWAGSFFVFSFTEKWGDDTASFFISDYLKVAAPGFSAEIVPGILIPLVLVWVAAIVVLGLGVAKGLEKANVIFIPLLVVAFGALVVRAVTLPGAADGLNALFTPDWSKIADPGVWVAAYGQIFFSLSICFGIMVTYSSYRRHRSNQTTPGLVVGFANSSFELLAGIGVFSIVGFMAHQQGVPVSELGGLKGVSLAFITFPKAISQMPAAWLFGALFFVSLLLAGFTSLLSIVEVVSAGFQDKFGWSYRKAAIGIGTVLAVLSIALFSTTTGLNTLDVMDNWANNFCVVFSALLTCVFAVWVTRRGKELAFHLSSLSTFKVKTTWLAIVGVVAPAMLAYMFIQTVITLIQDGYDPSSYPRWFEGVWGWGTVAGCVLGAIILTSLKWKHDPDRFEAWPNYQSIGK
jgi:NSS family neurotransmitter:Na+ symporter